MKSESFFSCTGNIDYEEFLLTDPKSELSETNNIIIFNNQLAKKQLQTNQQPTQALPKKMTSRYSSEDTEDPEDSSQNPITKTNKLSNKIQALNKKSSASKSDKIHSNSRSPNPEKFPQNSKESS